MSKRSDIASGDLLVWKKSKFSKTSNFYLNLIRFFTRSEYAHVGVAWRIDGRLFVVEASQPVVRIVPVKEADEFYHISMDIAWTEFSENWLLDKVGLKYSILDAVRAYLGKTIEDDRRYQCAELANEFYKLHGINLSYAFTPSLLVSEALENTFAELNYIKSNE